MVLSCPKCETRLQLDPAKAPARPFTVRCPKCQSVINVPPADANKNSAEPAGAVFEKPVVAPVFKLESGSSEETKASSNGPEGISDVAHLLAEALHQVESSSSVRGRKRPLWSRRKVLVCTTSSSRDAVAKVLATNNYEVFVAENTPQALGRMREERMDVVILEPSFDPVEQGAAFVTREVRLMRPADRRRIFFVSLLANGRTMDLHAAFLHNVNLIVNPSDVEQLPEALEISIRNYNELYEPFYAALNVAPI